MLLRFDPFRDFDRLADQLTAPRPAPAMPMDAFRKGDRVIVRFDLPGVDPESIDIEVERNVLSVRAQRSWERAEDEQVLAAERRHGAFSRQLILGDNLDGQQVDASYEDGVLTLRVPVAEQAKPRKVAIAHGDGGGRAIEATADEA
jgi:HSP20 family protein